MALPPGKKFQVVMARGLIKNWKIPVFFAIDTPMTKKVLDEITQCMEEKSFVVRGTSFDLGNKEFLSDIGFKNGANSYPNPADPSRSFFLVPDPPHLLKLFRNHLFDKGNL